MHYLMTHPGAAWALTVVHLRLSLLPVLIGLMSAVPLGLLVQRAPLLRRLTTATASVIFTIPSLALFVVLPLIIGTRILDEANVIVALAAYTTALLVRAVLEALDAVPAQVHDAATAIGYSRIAQMLKVELPLSIPVLVAGLRVVAVTNIAMVSVGSVIGIGGLGTWFTAGYQTNKSDQIVAGVVAMFLLAIVGGTGTRGRSADLVDGRAVLGRRPGGSPRATERNTSSASRVAQDHCLRDARHRRGVEARRSGGGVRPGRRACAVRRNCPAVIQSGE